MDNKTPLSEAIDKPEPQILPESPSIVKEEKTSPDIAGQTSPPGEFTHFTDMRALGVLLGFEDQTFDGLGKDADTLYNWAKETTNLKGGPEVILRIKFLIRDLGIPSKGRDLLRKLAHWTALDSRVRHLSLRKAAI